MKLILLFNSPKGIDLEKVNIKVYERDYPEPVFNEKKKTCKLKMPEKINSVDDLVYIKTVEIKSHYKHGSSHLNK